MRASLLVALDDWTAAGHRAAFVDSLALVFGLLALALLGALLVRAAVRHGRYRAVGVLSESDRRALRERIADAERKTTGEIAVVVLERSDDHPQAAWLATLACVLAAAVLIAGTTSAAHPSYVLVLLFAAGGVGWLLSHALPDFRRSFVSDARAEEMAEEQALQEFANLGMHRTEGRTGVLILVSLFERAVIVLGDDGIHAKVGAEHWLRTDAAIIAGIRERSLAAGLHAGIESVAAVLAEKCPRAEVDTNELPDHLVVRKR